MIKVSTGLRDAMMATGSFKSVMDNCVMRLYSGTVPATADAALGSAALVCPVTDDATAGGLDFGSAAVDGVLSKDAAQIWRGLNVATATPTFYRLETSVDDGTASTTQSRVQGTVGLAGADLNLSSTALISGASQSIDFYSVALPTA